MTSRRQILQIASAVALGYPFFPALSAGAEKVKRLMLIHGRSQQDHDPKTLQADWMSSLKRGAGQRSIPQAVEIAFPFYGDLLAGFEKNSAIPLTSEVHARGNDNVDEKFLAFQASFADDVRRKAGITDEQVDAEYGANPKARGPLNWEWVQAILRALDKNGGGLNQATLDIFTRDVYLYITLPGVRDAVNKTVSSLLTEEPTVVVAHSLGTVVAYDVLSKDTRNLKVPLLVTVGSPLGVRAVRDPFVPLHFPKPVSQWYNAFDTRDVVALYPLDEGNFPVKPAIENNSKVRNHTDNRHGIDGYLDDTNVATRILDALVS